MLTTSNCSDNDLLNLIAEDNEEAFSLLYNRYWQRLLYKAILKLKSETDAEEVVQDVFIAIWKSRKTLHITHSFNTYIAAVLRYKILAKMASNSKRIDGLVDDIDQFVFSDNATMDLLALNDLRGEIEIAILALPEKCQLVFRMSREKGLSDKQIAENLNLSAKTVEAHITRALKALRASINRFGLFTIFLIILLLS